MKNMAKEMKIAKKQKNDEIKAKGIVISEQADCIQKLENEKNLLEQTLRKDRKKIEKLVEEVNRKPKLVAPKIAPKVEPQVARYA